MYPWGLGTYGRRCLTHLAEDLPPLEVLIVDDNDSVDWVYMVKVVDKVPLPKVDGDLTYKLMTTCQVFRSLESPLCR